MSQLSLQWSLDQTSNNIIGISTGLLRAATSDNVQAIALLAAEQFGATVAMSQESCHKVFQLCNQSHRSPILSFVQIQIGWRKGDSGYQLAQSDAGLRFLGLTAALSTLSPWDASAVLYQLIYETAKDKTMVPTRQHLKQLILALQPRLAKCGLCESILGWVPLVTEGSMEPLKRGAIAPMPDLEESMTKIPASEIISSLVKSLSNLARIGDDRCWIKVVTSEYEAAWIIAFIKWCLGKPPRIVFPNVQSDWTRDTDLDKVVVEVSKNYEGTSTSVRIETYHRTDRIMDLIEELSFRSWARGLVPIQVYGRAMLRERFGSPGSLEYEACTEVLPYACSLILADLKASDTSVINSGSLYRMFPPKSKIIKTWYNYQGIDHGTVENTLPRLTGTIHQLPVMEELRSTLASKYNRHTFRFKSLDEHFDRLIMNLSICVADTLALSLLDGIDADGPQIWYESGARANSRPHTFSTLISEYLKAGRRFGNLGSSGCSATDIIDYAKSLLGHDHEDFEVVMSSSHGQTFFPRLFLTQLLGNNGNLCLCCFPGNIVVDDELYQSARSSFSRSTSWDDYIGYTQSRNIDRHNVREEDIAVVPRNDFGNHSTNWITQKSDGCLLMGITVPSIQGLLIVNPLTILRTAAKSIFVNCQHDRSSVCTYKDIDVPGGWPDYRSMARSDQVLRIFNTDNHEQMRFFVLTIGIPCIVRLQACLECCITTALFMRITHIIC